MMSYLTQLLALLPLGHAWARERDSRLAALLGAWADELARVDAAATSTEDEADPRYTTLLMADWERVYGLPDSCVTGDQSYGQRRLALVSAVTAIGAQTADYFIGIAGALGYADATVDELHPMNCNDTCNDELYGEAERFVWRLSVPATGGIVIADCNSPCDTPLASWGDNQLECRVRRHKPAHTEVVFAYI